MRKTPTHNCTDHPALPFPGPRSPTVGSVGSESPGKRGTGELLPSTTGPSETSSAGESRVLFLFCHEEAEDLPKVKPNRPDSFNWTICNKCLQATLKKYDIEKRISEENDYNLHKEGTRFYDVPFLSPLLLNVDIFDHILTCFRNCFSPQKTNLITP